MMQFEICYFDTISLKAIENFLLTRCYKNVKWQTLWTNFELNNKNLGKLFLVRQVLVNEERINKKKKGATATLNNLNAPTLPRKIEKPEKNLEVAST